MPGGSICSSLSYISVRDGGPGRGEASTRSIKLSGSQRAAQGDSQLPPGPVQVNIPFPFASPPNFSYAPT
ncbi:hypothetical protein PBY51_004531 [Eleginops maclovinus]|uniref:Uncharacterized protein n=1 Tax=Eleginops maclovinus TaxID=56733 RepID=A0AAN7XX18_ELEMC|nr:hypothetical protein PBY51_004531 [Eleginops maclovinus]